MSELAKEYYEERSARFGITTPIQIQGAQFDLLHPDAVISVHGSPTATDFATDRYEAIVQSAGNYVWKVIESGLDEEERSHAYYGRGLDTNSLSHVLTGKLVPNKKSLRTGKLTDIYTEAVARPELDPELIEKARKDYKVTHEPSEDTEVYLVTSAELKSGTRKLGRCAVLTVVGYYQNRYPKRPELTGYATQMMHAAFPNNTVIARSGLSASRTTRTILDAFAAQNPLINNVGRGKNA
jgi:hypothetical protein